MPPRSEPVPRARAALHWLSGFLLLGVMAGGVIAAALALWQNVDVQSLARSAAAVGASPPAPGERSGPLAGTGAGSAAAVLVSQASESFFPDSAFYGATVRRWLDLLDETGLDERMVYAGDDLTDLDPSTLLVVPQAACLSDRDIDAILGHAERGGGLLVTWAFGSRDERCRWRGWGPLLTLTGAGNLGEIDAPDPLFLTLPAAIPLSAGLPPGSRIELHPGPRVALEIPGPRAYWSDWALNRREAPPGARRDGGGPGIPVPDAAAALRTSDSGGRLAWFGFDLGQGAGPRDESRIRHALRNGIRWAGGHMIAEVSPWPGGHRAAVFIGEDVEAGFPNAAALARVLAEKRASATFFVVSDMVADHPTLADSLAAAGEIGSQTADHNSTAGLPLSEQVLRLGRSWRALRSWTGVPAAGLRPPEERFDDNTLRAWREVGGTYVAAINDARSAAPEIFQTASGPVVLLPRLINDDYHVFVRRGSRDPADLGTAWLEGVGKLTPLGGVSYLSLRTQVAGTPQRVWIVGDVIDSLRTRTDALWLATAGEIAEWWLSRAGVRISMTDLPMGAARIGVTAAGSVDGSWLEVFGEPSRSLVPYLGERPLPYARTSWGLRVPLPRLEAGASLEIELRPASS